VSTQECQEEIRSLPEFMTETYEFFQLIVKFSVIWKITTLYEHFLVPVTIPKWQTLMFKGNATCSGKQRKKQGVKTWTMLVVTAATLWSPSCL